MRGIPHHMIDVADPRTDTFSVVEFRDRARKIIDDIQARGKLPILCGGTGMYIHAVLTDSTIPEVLPNPELREKLEQYSAQELYAMLLEKDPTRADSIDPHNPVRLIRALEIIEELGAVPELESTPILHYPNSLFILCDRPDEELQARIRARLISRLEGGMIQEVEQLHDSGLSWERCYTLGLEYRYIGDYLQEKLTYEELIEQLYYAIWHYAKRQRTWFKKYAPPDTIVAHPENNRENVFEEVQKWLA